MVTVRSLETNGGRRLISTVFLKYDGSDETDYDGWVNELIALHCIITKQQQHHQLHCTYRSLSLYMLSVLVPSHFFSTKPHQLWKSTKWYIHHCCCQCLLYGVYLHPTNHLLSCSFPLKTMLVNMSLLTRWWVGEKKIEKWEPKMKIIFSATTNEEKKKKKIFFKKK
jgi:hypothetical protein